MPEIFVEMWVKLVRKVILRATFRPKNIYSNVSGYMAETNLGRSEKPFYFSHFFRMSIEGNRCFLTYSPVPWYMVVDVEL